MTIWDRLLQLSVSGPFTGTWLSLGTALGGLVALAILRRLLPVDERRRGAAAKSFLTIGLLLGLMRLALVAAGAGGSAAGRAVGALTTFFVAMGSVGCVLIFAFDILPARAEIRLPSILRDLIQLIAFGVIIFGVLSQSGVHVLSLVTTSAVLTAVIGLSLQNTIASLFAGAVLHMDRDLAVDDWIQVGQRTGRITQIRWRSTLLRTTDGDTVILPNNQLTTQEVYNFSRPSTRHRTSLRVTFHYRHPPNDVRHVMVEAAASTPGVLADPAPECFPVELADSGVTYLVRFWIDRFAQKFDIEGEVRTRVWYAAHRARLEIPYPTRTVSMTEDTDERRKAIAEIDTGEREKALERLELFAPLEPFERKSLAAGMRTVHFARGEEIIRQGAPGDSLFLIARGEVRVSLMQGSIDEQVALLGPGKFFGEMSLMTGDVRSATCTAESDVLCYVIDHAVFQRILTLRPHIADEMSSLLARRQEALGRKGGELSTKAAQAADSKKRLLERIRDFFGLAD